MLLYWIFPIIALALDYAAIKLKGTMVSVVLGLVAIGFLAIGLLFLVTPDKVVVAPVNITSSSGNILIPQYNLTYTATKTTESFAFLLGELMVFIQFAYGLLMLAFWIVYAREKKYR
jgi:hypothetical protein